jgi:tyrosyl-tRNA synthetase
VKVDGVVIRDPQHRIQPAGADVPVSLGAKKHGLVTR